MFVYSEIQPHLIFLIIVLVLSWSLATWLNWQNRKMHCELVPQFIWISRYGLFTGTLLMIFNLWFLSLFYDELKLGMTIIFAAIMVGIGSYLARFFEWLVFFQETEVGFWRKTIANYYFKEGIYTIFFIRTLIHKLVIKTKYIISYHYIWILLLN